MDIQTLLEQQKHIAEKAAKLEEESAKVEQQLEVASKAEEIQGKVAVAIASVPDAKALLGYSHSIFAFVDSNTNEWIVQVNPVTKLRGTTRPSGGSGNGNGNGTCNFNGNPVTISEAIKTQYGLKDSDYTSIRKLALALGVDEEDRHPDQTLRKVFPDVWGDIKSDVTETVTEAVKVEETAKVESETVEEVITV